jgi:hypothetical protein
MVEDREVSESICLRSSYLIYANRKIFLHNRQEGDLLGVFLGYNGVKGRRIKCSINTL